MPNVIPLIIAAVGVATALNVLLKRVNIPTIIGYIFTGIALGAVFHIHVHGNEGLEHIAEFGVVFLMFTIGLEFSAEHLRHTKKEVFGFGTGQVLVTGVVIAALAILLFKIDPKVAAIMGFGLSLSSTAIVHKLLNETGQLRSAYGRTSLGILVFQDIAVIPILLMITIFTNQDEKIGPLLLKTAGNAVIVLAILVGVGRYLLNDIFKRVSDANSKEIFMGLILFVVIGASFIAHHFGFSYSLGAFIAGMMIADTIHKYQVEADLIPFRDLLLGVFFVTVGLQIELAIVAKNIPAILGLTVAVMVAKTACAFAVIAFSGNKQLALKTALSLSQVGEFGLVAFSLLLSNKLLDAQSAQIVMVTVVISMIFTPFLVVNADRIVALVFRKKVDDDALVPADILGEHIILAGYGAFGQAVSDRLEKAGINHIVLATNTDDYVQARRRDRNVVFGDPSDRVLLEKLHIRRAIGTVIAIDDFAKIQQVSAAITLIDPSLKIIAKVANEADREQLKEFNHELLLDGNSQTASVLVDQIAKSRLLAQQTSSLQFLGEFSLAQPSRTIDLVAKEQARLLGIMSDSFNGLRGGCDIMRIKAFHDSHKVLGEIIRGALHRLLTEAHLSPAEYERANVILNTQDQLETMNALLEELGYHLKELAAVPATQSFARAVVEGLDTLLLSIIELSKQFDSDEMQMLKDLTSTEGQGLARIREVYLGGTHDLNPQTKARVLSATNHIERLRVLFGSVGANYEKLAKQPA